MSASANSHLTALETTALILSLFFVGVSIGGSSPLVSALLEDRGFSESSLVAPLIAAGFIDAVEHLDLLGWAVPALAGLSFATALPFAWLDTRFCRSSKTYLVEENHSAITVETKEDRDEC